MPIATGQTYATTADLAAVGMVPQILNTIAGATQLAALAAASALADSFLQSRWTLPLASWGSDLARCVAIIAAYDLLSARGYNPAAGADVNWRLRYLDELAWLKEIAQGEQTPSAVIDSGSPGGNPGNPGNGQNGDDSVTYATDGGFSLTTSNVRGWTKRGRQVGTYQGGGDF